MLINVTFFTDIVWSHHAGARHLTKQQECFRLVQSRFVHSPIPIGLVPIRPILNTDWSNIDWSCAFRPARLVQYRLVQSRFVLSGNVGLLVT